MQRGKKRIRWCCS